VKELRFYVCQIIRYKSKNLRVETCQNCLIFKNKFHVVIVNQIAEICQKSSKRIFFINRCAIGNIILYEWLKDFEHPL
jgi:hypothetical protein